MKNLQKFSESDYDVMEKALVELADRIGQGPRVHRLQVLARRLGEFRDQLKVVRESGERAAAQRAEWEAGAPERARLAAQAERDKLLALHPVDETGHWLVFRPNQDCDLGGRGSDTYLSFIEGTWTEAVNWALANKREHDYLGDPIIRRA
jgi:hypothetical protein